MPTPYEFALTRIQQAAAEGAARLDLSWLRLDTLPPEVWRLTRLQTTC